MARTAAQDRAIKKYEQKVDKVLLRLPKGTKAVIDAHAAQRGESTNGFIGRAILETIERDQNDLDYGTERKN